MHQSENGIAGLAGGWVLSVKQLSPQETDGILVPVCFCCGLFHYQVSVDALPVFRKSFPNALHYLDRFWLLLPDSVFEQRQFWKYFYSLYSCNYLHMINRSHNTLCLSYFKSLIERNCALPLAYKILDYGCGPGLALEVFGSEHLVGYDNNPDMQIQAKKYGVSTLDAENFFAMAPCSFDGGIACYVFHMAIPKKDIIKISQLLKTGGVFVANFYKGLGEREITLSFQEAGFTFQKVDEVEGRFGCVYVYRKQ